MNLRKHYKLYKSGKQWCTMALAVIASTIAMTTAVNADTNVANVSDQEVTSSTQNNSNDAILSDTNEVSLASVNIENNDTTISSDNSVEKTESSASTIQAKDNQNDLKSDSQKAENDPVDNVYAISLAAVQPQASNGKNGWVNENNQWTYYTNNEVASGRNYSYLPSINGNGKSWYLVDNGVVQSGVQQWAGSYYDFDANNNYQRVDNNYVQSQWGDWYLFGNDGRIQTGVQQWAGSYYYFDPVTYLRVDNDYRQSQWGDWYLFGNDGRILSGLQKWFGSYYYFDPVTYLKVTNKNITVNGINLHADNDGILSGVNRNANFLLSIHDAALDGWRQFGVLPSVTAAQAILESAWGQSALATQGHNLFGIKGSYNGQSITMRTAEYGNGGYYYINDAFRKYPSNYESIVDHGRFLATNSRYNNLLWKKDYTVVTQYLHADGYATDPKYASSLNNVIRTYNLDAWDREVI
ncbi:glucosaminidase domain-containing protein [Limosilactobacillus reuteri]|jgi:glucan-binding YG repeat protein|uniref:Mannosyl-glycoprotein endo-beta-N-acetylglucosamidase n=1 Tax=Limosilactobacillus reuteri TaxID=1598 RepID=A0A1Y2UFX7_LIMRT|nr:glucosaminidase domain-containing protein [Limosilactobacillus reuteri]MCI5548911.1 glucosaminidase domain-containing protein [Lactobacillus johnsonii]MCI6368657.1 glucosaminidase domain-containing protein [Limosilactobacillus reuteri]OTA42681.1 mannosyl-glycoprotein endo-beta-N-acetylglucosamidase [Limosilactobacillus reuteri]OTA66363.1 mannosyl-glycoprotein endo-beta-N-acetylglucosamidase [Limosilactobacillus reuteri]OTA76350.1 mannosyl-glycoprotein endo-beta-N-acetylglucosamidase [Limosi